MSFSKDPRIPVLLLLIGYLVLGFTVLGFNRSPTQALITSVSACSLEIFLCWLFYRRIEFPLSALITSCGLSILLNYSHSYYLLLIPVFFAIGSKYVFQFQGRHVYNPAMIGVVLSLIFTNELITSAPAYQWHGAVSMAYFILFPALMFFMPKINRMPLVLSFLGAFTIQIALRAIIMRHHLPFNTLFWGTLSSPPFLLFTFFMITDPKTSPTDRKQQIQTGIALASIDLLYHLRQSYYTFFYAAFTLASIRLVINHTRAALSFPGGIFGYLKKSFITSGYYRKLATLSLIALLSMFCYKTIIYPATGVDHLAWGFEEIPIKATGIQADWGAVYERLDPRIQHIAKWILSIGDSVAVGDFDGDGFQDLFFTFPLKKDGQRAALYRNLGGFKFERVQLDPALEERFRNIEKYGLPSNAMFVDYDGDGDLDLFITYAFGSPIMLKNLLKETGHATFVDVTKELGLEHYTNSASATFADLNRDGRLDLIIANVLPNDLPGYDHPTPLNFFHLPQAETPGDRRMFNFMHSSWNNANNGGLNEIYLQTADGKFVREDSAKWGITDTRWSLAVGAADLNQDGWPDLYFANDFGPDNLYFNEGGKHFSSVKGKIFGSIGRDTYKGMNVSIEDVDRNGWQDVYVSNVHHDMQAEGSLLWMFTPDGKIEDQATELGALNEQRFGWGAVIADFDNDGWMDIAQANGMVDDSIDKKAEKCPDYWYINEKIARSPPSIHRYADSWGDLRGSCIHGKESNRLYLNRGPSAKPQFIDVAALVGLSAPGNSRGMAAVDLDNDGKLDLVITHLFQGPTFFKNVDSDAQQKISHQWIGFSLRGDGHTCNTQGLGSVVKVHSIDAKNQAVVQTRELQLVSGLSAQSDGRLHFGLGDAKAEIFAEVKWCGGITEIFPHLKSGQYLNLIMGKGQKADNLK